jgi:hypothetical protein
MGWTKQAKKDAIGKWIKFDEEHPSWTCLFLGDPKIVEKVSTMGERKGEVYNAYEFPVEVDGEEKILSVTQRSLLRQLIEEEEEEPLPGRTLMIKCLDLKTKKEWKIREVKAEGSLETWKGKKSDTEETEKKEKSTPPAYDEENKDKEKFKAEVAKRTTARRKAKKTETETTGNATEDREAEETREFEAAEVE